MLEKLKQTQLKTHHLSKGFLLLFYSSASPFSIAPRHKPKAVNNHSLAVAINFKGILPAEPGKAYVLPFINLLLC